MEQPAQCQYCASHHLASLSFLTTPACPQENQHRRAFFSHSAVDTEETHSDPSLGTDDWGIQYHVSYLRTLEH